MRWTRRPKPIPNEHALMALDRAGWHGAKTLEVPPNVKLASLPPYSPPLNSKERVCLYLRERYLSLHVFPDLDAIIDAYCMAWNAYAEDASRTQSLCLQAWIEKFTY